MQKPLISIIVTAFEQPDSLTLLLRSLEIQDCECPFEVIVCDDGSSFSVFEKCSGHPGKLRLDLKYIWQPKLGYRASRAKNNGIRCAQGQYLLFLDADIIVKFDFLRAHLSAHIEPSLLICNPRRWIFESSALLSARNNH
jgi:glycosyltransferase involved in cell wall biosynthesis